MSKNQPGLKSLRIGPAVRIFDSRSYPSVETQNGRICFIPSFILHNSSFILSQMGVAGFEPATLRLSSACSNQLSYTPLGSFMIYDL